MCLPECEAVLLTDLSNYTFVSIFSKEIMKCLIYYLSVFYMLLKLMFSGCVCVGKRSQRWLQANYKSVARSSCRLGMCQHLR